MPTVASFGTIQVPSLKRSKSLVFVDCPPVQTLPRPFEPRMQAAVKVVVGTAGLVVVESVVSEREVVESVLEVEENVFEVLESVRELLLFVAEIVVVTVWDSVEVVSVSLVLVQGVLDSEVEDVRVVPPPAGTVVCKKRSKMS